MKLSDFDVLTFDCYGTLIDWETGILEALKPWLQKNQLELSDDTILQTFANYEGPIESEHPAPLYPDVLFRVHRALAKEWNLTSTDEEATQFSQSVKDWPAFSDTHEALKELKRYYKLAILSNVDNRSLNHSISKLGVEFDYVVTAEDVGSYKPDQRNFEYLLEKLTTDGIKKAKILHTAQSLFHDHAPATTIGLVTCWIHRRSGKDGWGATPAPPHETNTNFVFKTLSEMAVSRKSEL